jgi:peroxiredoxin
MKDKRSIAIVLSILAACAAVLFFSAAGSGDDAVKGVKLHSPAPPWELEDVNGKTVRSSDFTNKVVILDFWATWCPPCRAEIPGFIELQKQYQQQGLVVVGISLDQGGADVVKSFMQKMGVNYPVVLGNQKVSDAYGGIEGIPTTFVIDRQGRIANKHLGLTAKEEFVKEIEPLLKP